MPSDRLASLSLVTLLAVAGCGDEAGTTDVDDPGTTTPSSVPVGDYPDIPLMQSATSSTPMRSDTITTIEPLATVFNPDIDGITGTWSVVRMYGGQLALAPTVRTCTYFDVPGRLVRSENIRLVQAIANCPVAEGGYWELVEHPDAGDFLSRRMTQSVVRLPTPLVEDGVAQPGQNYQFVQDQQYAWGSGGPGDPYTGAMEFNPFNGVRHRCYVLGSPAGTAGLPCAWWPIISADVTTLPLTNPVYLKREIYWQKSAQSPFFDANATSVESTFTFAETYTTGADSSATSEFGRTVTPSATVGYEGFSAGVSAAFSQTFGSSVTVSREVSVTESFTTTVAANTTAFFEVWTLTEEYSFVNADGTPYTDPNYRFDIPGLLTRRSAGPSARTTVEFPIG